MAIIQSEWAAGVKSLCVSGEAGNVVANRFKVDISTLPTVSNGDILEIGGLPAFHEVIDWTLDNDAFGASTEVDVGIMSGMFGQVDDTRTSGSEMLAGSTALAASGIARGDSAAGFRVAKADYSRGIGVKFTTAPGAQATTGYVILTVLAAQ